MFTVRTATGLLVQFNHFDQFIRFHTALGLSYLHYDALVVGNNTTAAATTTLSTGGYQGLFSCNRVAVRIAVVEVNICPPSAASLMYNLVASAKRATR